VELTSAAEYLNTKYAEGQFVNTVKNHENNRQNMNSTIKIAAKVVEDLNERDENRNTHKKKGRHTTYKSKIIGVLSKTATE
jgi:hypothetical protein